MLRHYIVSLIVIIYSAHYTTKEGYFEYIWSYSPIDNIQRNAVYPACLITGGLHDPRVQYWEPAKYAAELRHQISSRSGPILIKMDMDSGK